MKFLLRFILLLLCFEAQASTSILSLAPNLTEVVFEFDKQNSLLANTVQCSFPEESKKIQKVGNFLNPSLEKILSLQPQLTLLSDTHPQSIKNFLERHHLKYFMVRTSSLNLYKNDVLFLGQLLNASIPAKKLISKFDQIQNRSTQKFKRFEAFFTLQWNPIYSVNQNNFINELLVLAGFNNVTQHFTAPFPIVNREFFLTNLVDIVFFPKDLGQPPHDLKQIRTLKNTHWGSLDPDLVLRLGPRTPEGYAQLINAHQNLEKSVTLKSSRLDSSL